LTDFRKKLAKKNYGCILENYMMNILVISSNQNKQPIAVMPIGACIAADAAERSGHKVAFLDLMFAKDIKRTVEDALTKKNFDVVGISVRNIDNNDINSPRTFFQDVTQLTEIVRKKSKAKIVLGGAAIPIMPQQLLRYTNTDLAVLGYGETVFPKLLNALEQNASFENVEGLAWIENNIFRRNEMNGARFNSCPSADFWKWIDVKSYLSRFSTVPMQTKRGCPYKCIYCTYGIIEGQAYQLSKADAIIDELEKFTEKGIHDIEFVDNVFNSPYEHAIEICERIAEKNLPLRLQSMELNPKFIDDALLDAMERAGFVGIGLTAESADDKVLESLGKGYTSNDVYQAAEVISRHRLPCFWIFLLGGPRETPDSVRRTLNFARHHIRKTDTAFFNVGLRIYPGTELENIARYEGILKSNPDEMLDTKFYFSPLLERKWLSRILNLYISKNLNFIDPESFTLPALSAVQKFVYAIGIRQPLWRYTRAIRRIMRFGRIYK
jgi:radical SAM superfamily enzyme YgiQ (UPF0313 family)